MLKGEDLIGIAQTGTGKTLAFLLPAMIHTEYQSVPRSERKGPNVLILAPTRELALQIEKEVAKYQFRNMKAYVLSYTNVHTQNILIFFLTNSFFEYYYYLRLGKASVCVYGGGNRNAQIGDIQKGVEIIIATPGRLNDLVEAKVIDVCTITYLVLDEGE